MEPGLVLKHTNEEDSELAKCTWQPGAPIALQARSSCMLDDLLIIIMHSKRANARVNGVSRQHAAEHLQRFSVDAALCMTRSRSR